METELEYYEYLSQERIHNLYQQIRRRRWFHLPDFGIEGQLFPMPSLRFSAGRGQSPELDMTTQLKALLEHLTKHQANEVGTADEPRKYITGTLPMFTYHLPQGFGTRPDDEPEYIYYGASTSNTIVGLAGPYSNVHLSSPPQGEGGSQHISSALPYLVRVLAKEYHRQTRFKNRRYDESTALSFIRYAEKYNRAGRQLRNCRFFATVKLDSARMNRTQQGKRIILATPLYVAPAG